MSLAFAKLYHEKKLAVFPVKDFLSATSVGITEENGAVLDLNYAEDSKAHVDMNVVMTGSGEFVELQGTGEESTFTYAQLQDMLALASEGLREITGKQMDALGETAGLIAQGKGREQ